MSNRSRLLPDPVKAFLIVLLFVVVIALLSPEGRETLFGC